MWIPSVYPYSKNMQMFNCPSNTTQWKGAYIGQGFSYPFNGSLDLANLSTVAQPSQCTVNICGWYYWSNGTNNYESTSGTPLGGPSVKKWHNEGTNVAFVDGHVKWMQFGQIWRGNATWTTGEWAGSAANSKYWTLTGT